uniref:Uncharacterized protein n=1 Tax=Kwoniella bestiolae CBS 10118 TaxID=1296100 RepID=A0A1B9GD39_9TREE|nr:hypothetical protein I302_00429 [Kwoniella bestiolae CBS 10118]OCF28939.1 hypothetical protein I302_00429 [Kwoniella bestiolae CBS 10118]
MNRSFTLDIKFTDWFLITITDHTSRPSPSNKACFTESSQILKRHNAIFQSINKLTIRPIQPLAQPETAMKPGELSDILQGTPSTTSPVLSTLHTICLLGPPLVALTSFCHTLTILRHLCLPSTITFSLTESACGYSAFRKFLDYKMVKQNLKR